MFDPSTMAMLNAGSSILGKALSGGSSARSDAALRNDVANDFSGWNVNFGEGAIDSNRDQAAGGLGMWIVLGIAAVLVVKAWKK